MWEEQAGPRSGSYALRIANEEGVVGRYPVATPRASVGDLVVLDFMTVHRSTPNAGDGARWSMQIRYFNYRHPEGAESHWPGSFATGMSLKDRYPEFFVDVS
jgi:hypothetical protein